MTQESADEAVNDEEMEEALRPEKEETEEEKKKKKDENIKAVKRELVQIYSKGTYTGVHDGYSPTK